MERNKRRGYLLIELMIAVALVSFMGILIGTLKGHIAQWHQEASLYLKAATLARSLMEYESENHHPDSAFSIRKELSKPFKDIPYTTITLSLEFPFRGKKKKFTFIGGRAFYDTKS